MVSAIRLWFSELSRIETKWFGTLDLTSSLSDVRSSRIGLGREIVARRLQSVRIVCSKLILEPRSLKVSFTGMLQKLLFRGSSLFCLFTNGMDLVPRNSVLVTQLTASSTNLMALLAFVPSRSAFEIAAVLTPLHSAKVRLSRFAVGKCPRLASNKIADLSAESKQLFNALLCCVSWQCAVELWGGRGALMRGAWDVLRAKTEIESDSLSSCSSIQGTTALAIASVRVNRTMIALATTLVLLSQFLVTMSPFKSSTTEVAVARRERTFEISAWFLGLTALLGVGAMLAVSAKLPVAGVKTVHCVWAGSRLGGWTPEGWFAWGRVAGGWVVWGGGLWEMGGM